MELSTRATYIYFVILFYLCIFQTPLSKVLEVFGYADEIIALIAFPIAVIELEKNNFVIKKKYGHYLIFLVVFAVAGICGNITYRYQSFFSTALPELFLTVKFWLAIYAGSKLFKNLEIQAYAYKIYFHIKTVTTLFIVLVLLDNILGIFDSTIRYGLRSTELFYGVPTVFAAICVFLIALLTVIKPYVKGVRKWYIFLLLLMCSTLRSKAFAATLLFLLIYYFVLIKKKKLKLRILILFIPIFLLMGWNQIEYYFFSDIRLDSARYQLLSTALQIMGDSFPIGTGFGTFASYMSGVHYSPVYSLYGISHVNGLREGYGAFISDSYWAMIIGETGCIGLISILIVLYQMFKRISLAKELNFSLYAAGLMVILYLLISSTGESAFANPIAIPLALILGLIYGKIDKRLSKSN